MADVNRIDFSEPERLTEEEDDDTLAAIDRGANAADAGRVTPLEEVRRKLQQWHTESSLPKTR